MRYVQQDSFSESRRTQAGIVNGASAVKGMVRVDSYLYIVVNYQESQLQDSISVLKVDMRSGTILYQVQIYSHYEDIQCTHIAVAGLSLVLACTVRYTSNITQVLALSVNRELSFSQLPPGFVRYENKTFVGEPIAFKRTFLTMSTKTFDRTAEEYTFNPAQEKPTLRPSVAPTQLPSSEPSSAPSGQPSSSPTSAPSISPQPTSHPSSSGPTNTYKPTVKPTQRPSRVPSRTPTVSPTKTSTIEPTVRPSTKPSTLPSVQPSLAISKTPTRMSTVRPTRNPSMDPTVVPTQVPTSEVSTVLVSAAIGRTKQKADDAVMIFLYVVAGVTGAWCMYQLLKCCVHVQHNYDKKKKLRAELKDIRMSIRDEASRRLPTPSPVDQPIGAFASSSSIDAGITTVPGRMRGAYATGTPIILNRTNSNDSSSVVLSSLHSSERSDILGSQNSEEQYLEEYNASSEYTKSNENMMKKGSNEGNADNSRRCSGSSHKSSYASNSSDGQSDSIYSESTMDKISAESSTKSMEDAASVNDNSRS